MKVNKNEEGRLLLAKYKTFQAFQISTLFLFLAMRSWQYWLLFNFLSIVSGPFQQLFFLFAIFQQYFHAGTYYYYFLTFPASFWIPIFFSNLNCNCSDLLDMRNLQEQDGKAFCYQKLFWLFTVWINCSSDPEKLLKFEAESRKFEKKIEGQNNFVNNIPFLTLSCRFLHHNYYFPIWMLYWRHKIVDGAEF